MPSSFASCAAALLGFAAITSSANAQPTAADLAAELRALDGSVFPANDDRVRDLIRRDQKARLQVAASRENDAWHAVQNRVDWEKFRDARLRALRESIGAFPPVAGDLKTRVVRSLDGDGCRIENLVYEPRPGLVVTANLYVPAKPSKSMPGILISSSHHNPKTQGELQDMGMTWARQGCVVLVPDHLGHGERRQHPFRTEKDYAGSFRLGRQDYFFRYNTGVQLQLVGESLIGWMVWDLMRGIDVLLSQPGVDAKRLILLGSVAGGGDPAAVTAALDARVQAVVPFNFGGPQPDYAVPADAERDFYWFGEAYWESTRCLRLGARDGFAQWVIVSAVAPRRLIYAHEFAWNRERDPAWPRIQQVFRWYDAGDYLAVAFGQGTLTGTPPESSHCNNIGPLHRSRIYPTLQRWFDMPIPAEYSGRRTPEELHCLTTEPARALRARPAHELAAELAAKYLQAARQRLSDSTPEDRRGQLRQDWARLMGDVEPKGVAKVLEQRKQLVAGLAVERLALEVEPGIVVPLLLFTPDHKPDTRVPCVLGLSQEGKQSFLRERSVAVAELLRGGAAVCLVDVRGTGETRRADESRRYNSAATSLSATEWLLGQTLVGARLRDLRSVLRYLDKRADIDPDRVALWGDSLAMPNSSDHNLAVPLDADTFPRQAEPLGGLLALFGALFEEKVRAVYVHGGLSGYDSLLASPFCYVPHDALIPGALKVGDLADVVAALAPRPVRLHGLVDGLNRLIADDALAKTYELARKAYAKTESKLQMLAGEAADDSAASWILLSIK